jgi:membrane peptidoglycan carboxypeptidase
MLLLEPFMNLHANFSQGGGLNHALAQSTSDTTKSTSSTQKKSSSTSKTTSTNKKPTSTTKKTTTTKKPTTTTTKKTSTTTRKTPLTTKKPSSTATKKTTTTQKNTAKKTSSTRSNPPKSTAQSVTATPVAWSASRLVDPRQSLDNKQVALDTPFGQLNWASLQGKITTSQGKMYAQEKGYKLELTLDPQLQKAMENQIEGKRISFGATVLIDPKTGKILAIAQGSSGSQSAATEAIAPAASLMKIVTASMAIERQNVTPNTMISFYGGCGHLADGSWLNQPSRDKQTMSLATAFGRSCNPVFAKLAVYDGGLGALQMYSDKYFFNRPIPSDLYIQTSSFILPEAKTATVQELGEAGAGFGATRLSPIHAALLGATVAAEGTMMMPHIVARAYNAKGDKVYEAKPQFIGKPITKDTAQEMEILMQATVSKGTSRRAFKRAGTAAEVDHLGGKTGTLLDPENRALLYTWFSGLAFVDDQAFAIGTLTASPQGAIIRASAVAQASLAEVLRVEK